MKRLKVTILAVILSFVFVLSSSAVVVFTNNASSLVADVGGLSDVDTTVNVTGGDGALFPNPTSPDYFMATLVDSSGNREIVKVTARSTDTLTIDRAEEGTSARAFAQGSIISHRLTAGVLDEFGQIRSVTSYGGMAAMVSSIGATVTSVYCKSTQAIADNLVVPATLTILAFQECSLEPAAGKTLTMNSTPIAGDYSIVGGAGTVNGAGPGYSWAAWDGGSDAEMTIGGNGADGLLAVYSEQGGTDYSFSFAPHATMTEATPYLMPAADGTSGQCLQTDGSFNLSFATPVPDTATITSRGVQYLFPGQFDRSRIHYKDADEFYLEAGSYMVKDKYAHWTSQLTEAIVGLAGATWHYVYLDYSAITSGTAITNTEIIVSTTAPTWNGTYQQPMNGDDRAIMMFLTAGANTLTEWHHNDGGDLILYVSPVADLSVVDIDDTC